MNVRSTGTMGFDLRRHLHANGFDEWCGEG